jgi:hypothetical protein
MRIEKVHTPTVPDGRPAANNISWDSAQPTSGWDSAIGCHLTDVFDKFKEIKNRVKTLIATFHRSIIFTKLSNLATRHSNLECLTKYGAN